MSASSAVRRNPRSEVVDMLTGELSRPDGQPREAATAIERWLIGQDMDQEERRDFLRMVMMTGGVPSDTQPGYIADMVAMSGAGEGPEPTRTMMEQFGENVAWAKEQGAAIINKVMTRQRGQRTEMAAWAREALDEEQDVIATTAAAILETNAMVRGDREWTQSEAELMANEVMGLADVERACGFVGHCWSSGSICMAELDDIGATAAKMEEAINEATGRGTAHVGVQISMTVMCLTHINDAIIEAGETEDESSEANALEKATKWLEVYRNIPGATT